MSFLLLENFLIHKYFDFFFAIQVQYWPILFFFFETMNASCCVQKSNSQLLTTTELFELLPKKKRVIDKFNLDLKLFHIWNEIVGRVLQGEI